MNVQDRIRVIEDFEFRPAGHVRPSKCQVTLVRNLPDPQVGKTLAIFSELHLPLSKSVTNGAEWIATTLVQQEGLDPGQVIFVEHYPDRGESDRPAGGTFDFITFDWETTDRTVQVLQAVNPRWQPGTRATVEAMAGIRLEQVHSIFALLEDQNQTGFITDDSNDY